MQSVNDEMQEGKSAPEANTEAKKDENISSTVKEKVETEKEFGALWVVGKVVNTEDMSLRPNIEPLLRWLTLRQLKSYLRATYMGKTSGEASKDIFEENFRSINRLSREDKVGFGRLCQLVDLLVYEMDSNSHDSTKIMISDDRLRIRDELERLARRVDAVSSEDVSWLWPRKHEEQMLLIHLLAKLAPSPLPRPVGASEAEKVQSAMMPSISFKDWYLSVTGEPLKDGDLDDQVSWLDDAIRGLQDSSKKIKAVSDYYNLFWEYHQKQLPRGTNIGQSLHNFAVTLEDVPGREPETFDFFQKATELYINGNTIALFAEFLIGLLSDPNRLTNIMPSRIKNDEALRKKIADLVDNIPASDPQDIIRKIMIRTRLEALNYGIHQMDNVSRLLLKIIDKNQEIFIEVIRQNGRRGLARFDNALDKIFQGALLKQKTLPMLRIWFLLEQNAPSDAWIPVCYIANNYCGESKDGSREEHLGIQLSGYLLRLAELYGNAPEYSSLVWSQVLNLLSKYKPQTVSPQLFETGIIISGILSGDLETWFARSNRVTERVQGIPTVKEMFESVRRVKEVIGTTDFSGLNPAETVAYNFILWATGAAQGEPPSPWAELFKINEKFHSVDGLAEFAEHAGITGYAAPLLKTEEAMEMYDEEQFPVIDKFVPKFPQSIKWSPENSITSVLAKRYVKESANDEKQ